MDGLEFMVGTWLGEKDGDPVEEHWSDVRYGVMLGSLRWYKHERLHLTEIMEIASGTPIVLRCRHFRAGLVALEDRPVLFELEGTDGSSSVWRHVAEGPKQRMRYERRGDSMTVEFEAEAGPPLVDGVFRFSLA